MIRVVPFLPAHMDFCDFDATFADLAKREDGQQLATSKEAWTWVDDAGDVVAIVGAFETHDRVLFLWGFMSKNACRHLHAILRFCRRWVRGLDAVRCEATIIKNFRPGHRAMRLLGFKRETTRPMKLWDGVADFHLYAKVRVN